MASIAFTVEAAVSEASAELCGPWAQLRVLLAADIEAAIAEARRSFESTTVVKLGGSAVAVAGGVVSVVGFALLMASLGPALPIAIAGTVVAVGGGVGGGAAAVRHAAAQTGIARRVRQHFNESRCLLERLVDQLAAALLTQAKLSVRLHRDKRTGSRVCRLLAWLMSEMHSCRKLQARLLSEAGVPNERAAEIPSAQRADLLLTLVVAAHEFVVERLADDFVGSGVCAVNSSGTLRHRLDQTERKVEERNDGDRFCFGKGRSVAEELVCEESEAEWQSRRGVEFEGLTNRGFRAGEQSGEDSETEGQISKGIGADNVGLVGRKIKINRQTKDKDLLENGREAQHNRSSESPPADRKTTELDSVECERLIVALTSAARLTLSLFRVSLFGSADAGNLPSGEALAATLKSAALHCNLDITEGVVQGVGRASALSMARVLGTAVGSAASTALDAGLLVYYAKQLHDFRRKGREPELVVQLQAMQLTVQLQHAEVLNLCTRQKSFSDL